MIDSILNSIKKEYIGIEEDYVHFDGNIIMLINSEFGVLNQRGVGPKEPFHITGPLETWDDFFGEKTTLQMAKELIGIKVKLGFDPPQNASLLQAYKERADELEWRLSIFDDDTWPKKEEEEEE